MRKDYRPYIIKKAYLKFQKLYTSHFIKPQLDFLGTGFTFMLPWYLHIFGGPIRIGDFATVIAAVDKRINLIVWPQKKGLGYINIGRFCIISPGVRISSACSIDIADNCMIASNVYITDCDWHGIYNRISFGKSAPIKLEENVWIGDSVIICKGVTIGYNSIIGAGSVVIESIPPNVIAAGNPAKVVKNLDSTKKIISRHKYFEDPIKLTKEFIKWEHAVLDNNNFWNWIKHFFFPSKGD